MSLILLNVSASLTDGTQFRFDVCLRETGRIVAGAVDPKAGGHTSRIQAQWTPPLQA